MPADGATDVAPDSLLALRFSQPLQVETVNSTTVMLSDSQGSIAATVVTAEGGMLAFILPQAPLQPGTIYTISLTGLTDTAGTALPVTTLRFTTDSGLSDRRLSDFRSDSELINSELKDSLKDSGLPDSRAASPPDDEEWIPDANNFRGDWRSHRPDPPIRFLPPLQAEPGVTALSGQVLALNGRPLQGVILAIEGQQTQTDANGQFLLRLPDLLVSGLQELVIDGQEIGPGNQTYGLYEVGVEIELGSTTVLPYTIWLPRIDTAHAVTIPSPTTAEVVVTTPRIPGLELHIPPNTTIRDHEGQVVTAVSITAIPIDRTPYPLPANVQVPVYFTIQPGGAYVGGASQGSGAWLVYPNYTSQPAGARFDFWRYDPEFPGGWSVYGQGTATPNGKQVVPDPGVRLYEFTGAMINSGQTPPPEGPPPCDSDQECCETGKDGNPIDLATGLKVETVTDLTLPDVLPLRLTRTYRPRDTNTRPFGIGATHEYAMFLWSADQYQEADLILPDGGRVHYVRISPGTGYTTAVFEHTTTPTRFYKSKIAWNGNGWDLTLTDGTEYVFGENAPLQAIRDRNGNTISLAWSGTNQFGSPSGTITQVTSPNGRWIAFTYDASNRITQATDNIGRTVSYTYDGSGRLWKVTDAGGGITEYTYDTAHRVLTKKDPRNNTVYTLQYDSGGRVTQETVAGGGVYQFAYTLDGSGKITQVDITDPRSIARRVTFNTGGYILTDTRALGRPEQQTTTYTRQAGTNFIQSKTDPLGRRTDYTYDAMGNTTSITRLAGTPQAMTTSYTHEPTFNLLASITDPLGHTTTYTLDSKGNLIRTTNPLNHETSATYNASGQPVSITDALGNTRQLTYSFGDLATTTDPLGNTATWFTDNAGRFVSVTNSLGQQTRYSYDASGRLTQMTDPLGQVTSFTYDPNGNLLSLTDAKGGATMYTYDTKNRLANRRDPLLRTESFQYDGKDNLTQATDRKAQIRSITYDGLNRPIQVTYADGSSTTYTYDAGNRITQTVDTISGTITRTYDGLDRLLSETTPQGTVSYTYDAAGRRTSMTVAGQPTVNYTYDNLDRLTQITQGTATATFAYDAASRRTSLTLPNGIEVTYGYDTTSLLTNLTYKKDATVLGDLTYTYDKAGRRTAVGGSFARTGLPQALSTATYDAANQQLALGNKSMTFDANGNLATLTDPSGTTTYTWNVRNKLAAFSGPGVTASFQHDPLGRRSRKTINGVTTEFLYDKVNPVQELTGGVPTANLLTGLEVDELLTRTDSSGTRSFLADVLGSVIALADAAGTVQTQYTYEPFGNTTVTGISSTNAFQYTGRENDGTGLYYYRARYYNPTLQRFISVDPIGFEGGDPTLYGYVLNAPSNARDPSGLGIQKPGCDYIPDTPCRRRCCDIHDRCYNDNNCDMGTWVREDPPCNQCNADVLRCFAECGRDDPMPPIPGGPPIDVPKIFEWPF